MTNHHPARPPRPRAARDDTLREPSGHHPRPGTAPCLSGSRSRRPGRGRASRARGGGPQGCPEGRRSADGGRPPAAPQMDRPARGDPYRGAVDGRAAVLEPVGAGSVDHVPQQTWATLLWDVETTNPVAPEMSDPSKVLEFHAHRRQPRRSGRVLPAHAGMVPTRPGCPRWSRCAPRARGDGPFSASSRRPPKRCSPRTRGWSPLSRDPGPGRAVLPAHAGMVPWTPTTR